jgi:hypothetical protein
MSLPGSRKPREEFMAEKDSDRGFDTMTFILRKQDFSKMGTKPLDVSMIPAEGISFYVMRLAKLIVVQPDGDFFIGRNILKDLWSPLVNLSEADGFASSVSRRHAMIHPLKDGYEITDLFSRNGTRLNDNRLVPNKPYLLASGAQLSVGQELLMVIFRPFASSWPK